MCFDSRLLSDYIAISLKIPDWLIDNWNKFLRYFQIWHFKVLTWSTKTPVYDPDIEIDIAKYINNFHFKKLYPYKYSEDFSRAIQAP